MKNTDTQGFVIGRDDFSKISAVEGITFTPSMQAFIKALDARALSPSQRRSEIAKRYTVGRK